MKVFLKLSGRVGECSNRPTITLDFRPPGVFVYRSPRGRVPVLFWFEEATPDQVRWQRYIVDWRPS